MDLLLGISKGFHNLPKLYGEEVRPTGRVTGIKSGLQTAGKVGLIVHIVVLCANKYSGVWTWIF
jgi:hypothetical protein